MRLTIHGERALCPMFAGNRQCSTECAWCREARTIATLYSLSQHIGWYCAVTPTPEVRSDYMQEDSE